MCSRPMAKWHYLGTTVQWYSGKFHPTDKAMLSAQKVRKMWEIPLKHRGKMLRPRNIAIHVQPSSSSFSCRGLCHRGTIFHSWYVIHRTSAGCCSIAPKRVAKNFFFGTLKGGQYTSQNHLAWGASFRSGQWHWRLCIKYLELDRTFQHWKSKKCMVFLSFPWSFSYSMEIDISRAFICITSAPVLGSTVIKLFFETYFHDNKSKQDSIVTFIECVFIAFNQVNKNLKFKNLSTMPEIFNNHKSITSVVCVTALKNVMSF